MAPPGEAAGASRRGANARAPRGWRTTERAVSDLPTTEAKLWLLRATWRTDPEPRDNPRTAHLARSACPNDPSPLAVPVVICS